MTNISTATSNVIPFDFRGHSIRTVVVDGEPWFVAADACKVLSLTNTTTALLALDEDERSKFNLGRQGEVNIVNESGLYTLILRCRDAVTKGSKPHAFRRWVTAEVLPAIRKHGHYSDAGGKMATLVNDVIGMSGANLIGGVISQKVSVLPAGVQRQAKHKLHAILHTRFNVPRTELIPADKLDTACQYVGAYALEGEWIAKPEQGGTVLTDSHLYDVYFLSWHFKCLYEIFNDYKLYSHFSGVGSPVGAKMIDHFRDGHAGYHKLQELAPEFEAVQKRMGINQYRGMGVAA